MERESEEVVASKANCGITLLRRVLFSSVFLLGSGHGCGRSACRETKKRQREECNALNGARGELRAVTRQARDPNGIRFIKLRRNVMRNGCAVLAMSALLALPLCAQQKNGGAGGETTNTAAGAEKSASSSKPTGNGKAVAAKGLLALPAMPSQTPFPGPAPAA